MISRRLIRIKAFKTLYACEASGDVDVPAAIKEFDFSCEKVRELYYFIMNFSASLVDVARQHIDSGMSKFKPTEEEMNPNMKFVNNRFFSLLSDDPKFGMFCQKHSLLWNEYDVFVRKVYNSMVTKEYYKNYMESGTDSFEEDCTLASCIFQDEFEDDEDLAQILEEKSIYWIDDLEYVLNVIIANIEVTKKKKAIVHPTTFTKEEDKAYGERLLGDAMLRYDEYFGLVSGKLNNWDTERLVPTDAALIILGITEAVSFPTIPVKVTINEYVEIAKYYSTPNSRIFVNGLLDRVIQEKIASGEVSKQGRGLLQN